MVIFLFSHYLVMVANKNFKISMKENVCKEVLHQMSKIGIITCKTWMSLKLSLFYK